MTKVKRRGRGKHRPEEYTVVQTGAANGASNPNLTSHMACPPEFESNLNPFSVMTTPLATLKVMEAAIHIDVSSRTQKRKYHPTLCDREGCDDGGRIISVEEFFEMMNTHEWLELSSSCNHAFHTPRPTISSLLSGEEKEMWECFHQTVRSFEEGERLLLDFVLVTTWTAECSSNADGSSSDHSTGVMMYPLYRIDNRESSLYLESLPPPSPKSTAHPETILKTSNDTTRMDILVKMYHQSRKYFHHTHLISNGSDPCSSNDQKIDLDSMTDVHYSLIWWKNARRVAKLMLESKSYKSKPTDTKTQVVADNFSSYANTDTINRSSKNKCAHDTEEDSSHTRINSEEKHMSLQERMRVRSNLRELYNNKHVNTSMSQRSSSANVKNTKALLELADALRSYSHRRGLSGRGALERSKKNPVIVRLTMADFLKDARISWSAVIRNFSGGSRGNARLAAASGGISSRGQTMSTVVSIDLSRVIFQIRLDIMRNTDVNRSSVEDTASLSSNVLSERRQMEIYLLSLLESLMTIAPNWIRVHRIPPSLFSSKSASSGACGTTISKTPGAMDENAVSHNLLDARMRLKLHNVHDSVIVIRDDEVNYSKDVRARLIGAIPSHLSSSTNECSQKRSSGGILKKNDQPINLGVSGFKHAIKDVLGPSSIADSIVPASFRRMYGKSIGMDTY